jgi:hypothetical protein
MAHFITLGANATTCRRQAIHILASIPPPIPPPIPPATLKIPPSKAWRRLHRANATSPRAAHCIASCTAQPAPRECNQPARSALHRKQSARRATQRSALHRILYSAAHRANAWVYSERNAVTHLPGLPPSYRVSCEQESVVSKNQEKKEKIESFHASTRAGLTRARSLNAWVYSERNAVTHLPGLPPSYRVSCEQESVVSKNQEKKEKIESRKTSVRKNTPFSVLRSQNALKTPRLRLLKC